MIVTCPHCTTRYRLPVPLLGPSGARVHCPRCRERFVVTVTAIGDSGSPAAGSTPFAAAATPRPFPEEGREHEARDVEGVLERRRRSPLETRLPESRDPAREAVAELERRSGGVLVAAHARGRLFSETGRELLDAFDEYRRRAGGAGSATDFRRALSERLGIDLGPRGR